MAAVVESTLLRSVIGHGPAVRECRSPGDPSTLLDQEAEVIAGAVDARKQEFAAGRACARAAAREVGRDLAALLPGTDRAPQWPAGVVGSITHCHGFAGAAIASVDGWIALGIDAEPALPLPTHIVATVLTPRERTGLTHLPSGDAQPWDRIVFSAKESLYKAWYPVHQTWLGFEDAEVELRSDRTFRVRLTLPRTGIFPRILFGRWAIRDGVLATGISLKAD